MTGASTSSMALVVFVALTVIYMIIYFRSRNTSRSWLHWGYVVTVILIEYVMNIIISSSICGDYQLVTALFATMLSWGLIFWSFVYLLIENPGWLAPFANTFGNFIIRNTDFDNTLDAIFGDQSSAITDKSVKNMIARVNSDKFILVNELTPKNFETFITSMGNTFPKLNEDNTKTKLKDMIILKYAVANFVWYILLGILATSMSYNYLLKTSCNIRKTK